MVIIHQITPFKLDLRISLKFLISYVDQVRVNVNS